ncbi:ABC transporter substrate-binding protein [Cellulomonas bogoriensis]|uniref:ABC transporter substrate-binding protein n=1 Tax=Cellulomonas bogoriensis 69B4 = DSM 16987 TaxID=1386082 RepID=A0A0A0BZ67_9CELL|nr:extracellular solute-binding protein [Cellulomonas bogoriensis]KGM13688.1 ABC transporter substrate-binding protein [Cellulomonas bogoriensis 69B4 = DSM 16987]
MRDKPDTITSTRRALVRAGSILTVAALAACAPPGSGSTTPEPDPDAPVQEVSTELTTEDVELDLYLESGFTDAWDALQEEFTRQYPNVTFRVRADSFQNLAQNAVRIINAPDAPDLIRFPTVASAAKDGLLANLDPYAAAYGWDDWPQGTLNQVRVEPDGSRGSGSLYALGVGYNTTGLYYNKDIAADLGIEVPPATIAELEQMMEAAKAADVVPMMVGNADFTVAFPYQMVQNQQPGLDDLKDWIYNAPDASFDIEASVTAAETIQRWAGEGYFPDDVNAIDYSTMVGRFADGRALFMPNGDWEAGGLTSGGSGDFGFFLFPGVQEGAPHVAMAAPATYVVPSTASNKDEVAYFLDWIHTDEVARQIVLDVTGSSPGGPAELPAPVAPEGSVIEETLAAAATLADDDGAIDFIGNATTGILTSTIGPDLQLLVSDRITPEEFAASVQQGYQTELGR